MRDADRTNRDVDTHDHRAADTVGEAAGGISGAVTGAAIGSIAGPVGTVVGGIAGAVGGWWAGREIAEMASDLAHDDDEYFRQHYEASPARLADRRYEEMRPVYQIGHLAALNPDYVGRDFEEVETDLRRGWSGDTPRRVGEWDAVRGYAREGFSRGRVAATSPDHPLWKRRNLDKAAADRKDNVLGAADRTARRLEEVTGTAMDVMPSHTTSTNDSSVATQGGIDRMTTPVPEGTETTTRKDVQGGTDVGGSSRPI